MKTINNVIDADTCVHKVRVLSNLQVAEADCRCAICTDTRQSLCDRYLPVSHTQIPIRRGSFALYNGYYQRHAD